MKKNKTTLTQIAKACGVSIMTASRAFKDRHLVEESTRELILKTAAQRGYQPDGQMGRPRRQGKASRNTAQVIIEMKAGPAYLFQAYLLGIIERNLARQEYDCLLRTYDGSYENFVWLCELLRLEPQRPTMIMGDFPLNHLRTLLKLCPQSLLVDYSENPRLTCPYNSIGFDNMEAARLAVRHLGSIGKRKILLLKGNPEHFFSIEIERGYREALQFLQSEGQKNAPPLDERLILNADFTSTGAYQALARCLKGGLVFDAVFTNDEMALGVLKALREYGKKIPQDVAVCGCDGLPFGAFMDPPLSTIILDYAELGKAAVEKVLAPGKGTPIRIRFVPTLEPRASTLLR